MYGQHTPESMDGSGFVTIPAHRRITKEKMMVSLCPRSRLINWSRATGSAVPSCVSLLILHTAESSAYSHGISAAFPQGIHIYTVNRYWVSPEFIGSRFCMSMAFTAMSPLTQCL